MDTALIYQIGSVKTKIIRLLYISDLVLQVVS